MSDVTQRTGVAALKASAAAGPIALFVIAIGQLLSGGTLAIRMGPTEASNLVGLAVFFSIGAAIVAFVPNYVGTMIMGWASARNLGLRHPAAWGLAGAAIMGVPELVIEGANDPVTAAYAAIGAISAMACRLGVRWDDAEPAKRLIA